MRISSNGLLMTRMDMYLTVLTIGAFSLKAVYADCVQTITSEGGVEGTIQSPNYPKPYPMGLLCKYIFQGTLDERINITFLDFHLEPGVDAGCLYDYVDIYTVTINQELGFERRLCGDTLPGPMVSIQQRVELHFTTHHGRSYRGFKTHYSFVDEMWQPFPPSHPACGQSNIRGVGGVLTSPGFPDPYPAGIDCTWMIRVADDQKIFMNFLVLDMGLSVTCEDKTYVKIYNGFASPDRPPDESLCGQLYFIKTKIAEFKGNTFRAVVRFRNTEENPQRSTGFKLSWTAVKLPTVQNFPDGPRYVPCPEFHCQGGELCIDDTKMLCNSLQRFCIADSLRCNGIPNCGAYDLSDEHGCAARIVLITSGVVGPILLVATLVAVCITCRNYRIRREMREKAMASEQLTRGRSYQSSVTNIYTSVPPGEVKLSNFDRSPSMRRHAENHGNNIANCHGNGHHSLGRRDSHGPRSCMAGGPVATPAVQYGVTTDSYCSDTEQDYVSSSCSNYASPASLRYHGRTAVSYKVVHSAENHSTHSISATV